MPICREWRESYTSHQDLWRTLCCTDPFAANLGGGDTSSSSSDDGDNDDDSSSHEYDDDDDDDNSFCSLGDNTLLYKGKTKDHEEGNPLGEYRLLFTSFVRCLNYLQRIQQDARDGRPLSVMDYGTSYSRFPTFGVTKTLKKFLAKKKHGSLKSVIGSGSYRADEAPGVSSLPSAPIGVLADGGEVNPVRKGFLLLHVFISVVDVLLTFFRFVLCSIISHP
jgi:hypothetical protein